MLVRRAPDVGGIRWVVKPKYRQILSAYISYFRCLIVLELRTVQDSHASSHCAKIQNDWAIAIYVDVRKNIHDIWAWDGLLIIYNTTASLLCFIKGQAYDCLSCANIISWWRLQMKTFSALLALCAGNSPVTGWANNSEAGDLRCHAAHYDVIVMTQSSIF